MSDKDYSHRDVLDKLGVKPGQAVAFVDLGGSAIDADLRARVLDRVGRDLAADDETLDLVFVAADAASDVTAALERGKARLDPAGGIWVLTPKRGRPGFGCVSRYPLT